MMASGGYPGKYETNFEIKGTEADPKWDGMIFHAGTKISRRKLYSNGGRVLAITGRGGTVEDALKRSYEQAAKIQFQDAYYRKDIGADVLDLA